MNKRRIAQTNRNLRKIIALKAVFTAFRKTAATEEILKALEKEDEKTDFRRIRCPHCRWRPRASSRWFCADCDYPEYFYGGCGASWNTFETGGSCPGCRHRWRWTSCLRCGGWAKHEDWYAEADD